MKKNILVMILAVSGILLSCEGPQQSFENHTKIQLPKSGKQIQVFDNNFFVIIGKYVITDRKELDDFIVKNEFEKLEKDRPEVIESDNFLNKENQVIYNEDEFYYKSANTETSRWNMLIDKPTGELWIEVLYPGFSNNK